MTFIYAPSKKNSDTLTLNRYDGNEKKKRKKYDEQQKKNSE